MITDPTMVYFLLLLGIYGIFFEIVSPGLIAPGVIGVVSLLIALYGLQFFTINYFALALIVFGIVFIIVESLVPSFGLLGIGGTIAFVIGSFWLMGSDHGVSLIAWTAIAAVAVVNLLFFGLVLGTAIKSRKRPILNGPQLLIGEQGLTLDKVSPEGQALIRGEIWSVHSSVPIEPQRSIKVIAVHGLRLEVEECEGE